MNRRRFLQSAGVMASSMFVSALPLEAAANDIQIKKTNIVLIMADDLGYEAIGCNGAKDYKTPNLDRLAAEGMRFTHCYAQPLCTPSRVKIMTGRYNVRNYQHFGFLHEDEITFANVLKKVGYKTCVAGKWQLGKLGEQVRAFGFDSYCLWAGGYDKRFQDPNINCNDVILKDTKGKYGPDIFAGHICDFIEKNRSNPFFVYYPMALTHDPFVPTPDSPDWEENKGKKDTKYFADMVAYTDKIVGKIDTKLKTLGIRDDTLLIFTGDNGTLNQITTKMKSGPAITGGKGDTTNAGTHVPLIASWPKATPKGKVCDDLIDFTDFFSTVADLAQAPLPNVKIDGVSFLPQLKGQTGTPREYTYCFYHPNKKVKPNQFEMRIFVRDKHWKLYHDERLYNLDNDPLEQKPIYMKDDTPESKAAREKLFKHLTIPR